VKQDVTGKKAVGIDIGTDSIKIAFATRQGAGFKIGPTVEVNIKRENADKPDPEAVMEALEKALAKNRISGEVQVSALSTQRAAVRSIELPFDDVNTVRQIIKSEIEPHLPFPVENVIVDFYDTRTAEEGKMNVLLTAVNKTVIAEHLDLMHETGLEPEIIDVDFLSMFNTVSRLRPDLNEQSYMIVDIGASSTTVIYVTDNKPMAVRSLPIAGDFITLSIGKELDISVEEAERTKIEQGDAMAEEASAESDQAKGVITGLSNALDRFHQELTRTIRYFSSQIADSDYSRIILTGSSGRLKNLDKFLSRLFSAPTEVLTIDNAPSNIAIECDPAEFATAIGTAMAGIGECDYPMDFRKEEYKYPETLKRVANYLYTAGALLAAIIVVFFVGLVHRVNSLDSEFEILRASSTSLTQRIEPNASNMDEKAVKARLEELRGEIEFLKGKTPSSTINVLKDFSGRIPAELKVQVDSFYISERKIDIKGTISTQEAVYELKEKLAASEHVKSIDERQTTAVKGGRYKFEFRIKLK
jgi:type IV pilus assembly protein PilM